LYYTRKAESGSEDPLLTDLNDQQKNQARQFKQAVSQMSLDEAKAILKKLDPQLESAPPGERNLIKVLQQLLQEKIRNGGN
jgi:hypothetical protein